jgi:acetoacetyl-CoA synthetase
MWNWLTCSLATGATLVLFDGNPFYPDPGALWELAQDEKITVFGASASYLSSLQKAGVKPAEKYKLDSLRTILSTGSPLSEESFDYVYRDIKQDVQLCSISGGTDLNGCFALGNPLEPIYRGELQCRGLAMKVEAFDEMGQSVVGQQGELVCTAPFPSMPIYFWDDPDGKKYHHAYFDRYPNVWRHGDYVEINDRGGIVIHGRSDATLNPGGVRIGTADIYRYIENMDEIVDSIVVGQRWDGDTRIILFVKLKEKISLTDVSKEHIRSVIRKNLSPRHVPAKIISVPDIPYTLNMKKVELAVKKMIHNEPVLNKDSLKNPESLNYFKNLTELT